MTTPGKRARATRPYKNSDPTPSYHERHPRALLSISDPSAPSILTGGADAPSASNGFEARAGSKTLPLPWERLGHHSDARFQPASADPNYSLDPKTSYTPGSAGILPASRARATRPYARSILLSLLLILVQPLVLCSSALALETPPPLSGTAEFSEQYTALTKQILLKGVELERFSLNYRLESVKQPKFRQLRYFLGQETGAASILAFEITAMDQFHTGRTHPLKISKRALHGAFATVMAGEIIAGASSLVELGSNTLLAIKNKHEGFDPKSANRFVLKSMNEIDELLTRREALVEAHKDHPAYERAVVEGKILRELRKAFINEYANFHADARGYATYNNLFYLFNVATTALGATAAGIAYKAVNKPKLNGPTNILFIVTGSLAMASPLLSSAAGEWVRKHSYESFMRQAGEPPHFNTSILKTQRQLLQDKLINAEGSLMPALPSVDRLAIYTESDELFQKQLANETSASRHLEKVAVQSNLLGPLIGGCLMTQGILGTTGYYKYTFRPRKQINYYFHGAVVGTPGAALGVVATAGSLLMSWSYENKLRKQKRLPEQLINDRLTHLDDVEKIIHSL